MKCSRWFTKGDTSRCQGRTNDKTTINSNHDDYKVWRETRELRRGDVEKRTRREKKTNKNKKEKNLKTFKELLVCKSDMPVILLNWILKVERKRNSIFITKQNHESGMYTSKRKPATEVTTLSRSFQLM